MMKVLEHTAAKNYCQKLIELDDFLSCDKEDTDNTIQRCQEQWIIFNWLFVKECYILAKNFAKLADFGEYDYKYYDGEWELWHCNY